MGVSRFLKSKNSDIKCFAVEPKGVEPISGKTITKPLHLLQGSGYGSVPDLFKFDVLDGTLRYIFVDSSLLSFSAVSRQALKFDSLTCVFVASLAFQIKNPLNTKSCSERRKASTWVIQVELMSLQL